MLNLRAFSGAATRRHALTTITACLALGHPIAWAQDKSPEPPRTTVGNAKLNSKEIDFIKQVAEDSHAEVEASRLALEKGFSMEVKNFAQQMATAHGQTGQELAMLAANKGVKISEKPSLLQQGKLKLLSARDGQNFDLQYAEGMGVEAHQEAVRMFQKAMGESQDPDVKAFISKTLPTLQHHLAMAQQLNSSVRTAAGKKP
jgi:putative membrane protein